MQSLKTKKKVFQNSNFDKEIKEINFCLEQEINETFLKDIC
jgi:hypothetical protein